MTVSELMATLQGYPADMRVVVEGYEEGYDDLSPSQISIEQIALNAGTREYVGRHAVLRDLPGGAADPVAVVDALALHRTSH